MTTRNLLIAAAARPWTPLNLGNKLFAWWNADVLSSLTLSGNQVSAWRDLAFGTEVAQSTASSRPIWSATSFNGSPGVTFDGTDDRMSNLTQQARIPDTGGYYLMATVDQTALVADTTVRAIITLSSSNASQTSLRRAVASGQNRVAINIGGSAINASSGDFSGRTTPAMRTISSGATIYLNGASVGTSATAPVTSTIRTYIGCNHLANDNFWRGVVRDVISVSETLTTDEMSLLNAYLAQRRS